MQRALVEQRNNKALRLISFVNSPSNTRNRSAISKLQSKDNDTLLNSRCTLGSSDPGSGRRATEDGWANPLPRAPQLDLQGTELNRG